MAWVVDTCMLIDVLDDDPRFGRSSALTLDSYAGDGLVACPLTYAELRRPSRATLRSRTSSCTAWASTSGRTGRGRTPAAPMRPGTASSIGEEADRLPRRPLADILIGAFACRFQGLITRNAGDFEPIFPDLNLGRPGS